MNNKDMKRLLTLLSLSQRGPSTNPHATCGPLTEFLTLASFLSTDCFVQVAGGTFNCNRHNIC